MIGKLDWKQWVKIVLAAFLLADGALLFWNWQLRGTDPAEQARQRDRLRHQHAQLGADVQAARSIRDVVPDVDRQCDQFLKGHLPPAAGGYSAVVEDLNGISVRSGLTTKGVQYRQKEIASRGVTEVKVTASVEGSYANLVRFVNELERSRQFYVLEELTLAESSGSSVIRLSLQLKTYFRLKADAT
jgi:Tfp pilus assembly protein PilO